MLVKPQEHGLKLNSEAKSLLAKTVFSTQVSSQVESK